MLELIAGPVIGAIAGRSRDRANERSVNATNKFNAHQAKLHREWSEQQVLDARRFDVRQNRKLRRYNRKMDRLAYKRSKRDARAAERRARKYAKQDRRNQRRYDTPAAQRRRLEKAGINPAAGNYELGSAMPMSGAMPGAPMGFTPTGHATSGIAQGSFATAQPHLRGPSTLAGDLIQSISTYQQGQLAEADMALRATQMHMDNMRLQELMERSTMRPFVGGDYDVGSGPVGEGVGGAAGAGRLRYSPDIVGFGNELDDNSDYISPAEDWQFHYGDIVESTVGLGKLFTDVSTTMERNARLSRDEARQNRLDAVERSGVPWQFSSPYVDWESTPEVFNPMAFPNDPRVVPRSSDSVLAEQFDLFDRRPRSRPTGSHAFNLSTYLN